MQTSLQQEIHLIGIGGCGMSALAQLLLDDGHCVTGSDPAGHSLLEAAGVSIDPQQRGAFLHPGQRVVYSSAIPPTHPERERVEELSLPSLHRIELLRELIYDQTPLVVAGTHGKTTTTALLAHLLESLGEDPSYAIGGKLLSSQRNGKRGKGAYFVVESDESDGSFLHLPRAGAILTGVEGEHLDHYGNEAALFSAFSQFVDQIAHQEWISWSYADPFLRSLPLPGLSYGLEAGAALRATDLRQTPTQLEAEVHWKGKSWPLSLPMIGKHNLLNALGAIGLALQLGYQMEPLLKGIATFAGVGRRLERVGHQEHLLLFDDYAHHPTEIAATLQGLRQAIGPRPLIACFQPHRYSRLTSFYDAFTRAFRGVDRLYLMELYAAGEHGSTPPDLGEFAQLIERRSGASVLHLPDSLLLDELEEKTRQGDCLITLGAGSVTHVARRLASRWEEAPPAPLSLFLVGGGKSPEHEISLRTSKAYVKMLEETPVQVTSARLSRDNQTFHLGEGVFEEEGEGEETLSFLSGLARMRNHDLLFPLFHGGGLEGGWMAGLAELLNLPYAAPAPTGSALAMHKGLSKRVAQTLGIATPPWTSFFADEWRENPEEILLRASSLGYPLMVKAVDTGSSLGSLRIEDPSASSAAIDQLLSWGQEFVLEKWIEGWELQLALRGLSQEVTLSRVGRLQTLGTFFHYEAKYGPHALKTELDETLPPSLVASLQSQARQLYQTLGLDCSARIDFLIDREDQLWFIEINPIPGVSSSGSFFPRGWQGVSPTEVALSLIYQGRRRHLRRPTAS